MKEKHMTFVLVVVLLAVVVGGVATQASSGLCPQTHTTENPTSQLPNLETQDPTERPTP